MKTSIKIAVLAAILTAPAVQSGQWTYTDPTPGGGYTTWTPGYGMPITTTPTPGGGYSTYNPNPAPRPSTYDVIRSEQYYDLHIRPHLDPRRR